MIGNGTGHAGMPHRTAELLPTVFLLPPPTFGMRSDYTALFTLELPQFLFKALFLFQPSFLFFAQPQDYIDKFFLGFFDQEGFEIFSLDSGCHLSFLVGLGRPKVRGKFTARAGYLLKAYNRSNYFAAVRNRNHFSIPTSV